MSKVFTAEEVAQHNTRDDLYIIYKGKVYNCSEYLDEHPGGEEVIMDCAGTDATEPFEDIGHSEDAHEILANLEVGELKGGVPAKPVVSAASSSSLALGVAQRHSREPDLSLSACTYKSLGFYSSRSGGYPDMSAEARWLNHFETTIGQTQSTRFGPYSEQPPSYMSSDHGHAVTAVCEFSRNV
ncbi:hypothetical protein KL941_003975 [Ogataea angusta]|nr:hypothetical protein KL941_003975 [Ogataea angusta]